MKKISITHRKSLLAAIYATALALFATVSQPADAAGPQGSLSIAMRVSPAQTHINVGETTSALVRFVDRSIGCNVNVNSITLNAIPVSLFQISPPTLDTSNERVVEARFDLQAMAAGTNILHAVVLAEHNCTGNPEAIDFDADSLSITVNDTEPLRPVGVSGPLAPPNSTNPPPTAEATLTPPPALPTATPPPGRIIRIIRMP